MKTKMARVLLLLALALSALAPVTAARASAVWTVINTNDSGAGSLREAIGLAADGDSIVFAGGVTGTITLGSELDVNTSITITGPGASALSISGNDTVMVLNIWPGITVHVSNLTITHGKYSGLGGGIYSSGTLTLDHVVVSNNQATGNAGGGIYNAGSLTITNGVLSYNTAWDVGGAIYNNQGSSLSLTDVVVDHNQAGGAGGGLYMPNPGLSTPAGIYILNRVSITNNSAGALSAGGGIFLTASASISNTLIADNTAYGAGGIIWMDNDLTTFVPVTITLTNVTVSGNSAVDSSGGMLTYFTQASDSATMNNVTIADNHQTNPTGAGAGGYRADYGPALVNVKNTLIAGNTQAAAGGGADCYGTFNSLDYNLIQDTSGCTINGTTTHNITGVSAALGILAYHGGFADTMPLLTGSPAIDAGNDATCAGIDQRGASRPQGAHCDIGAFEYGAYNWVVNTLLDHDDGVCDSDCTLREAVTYATDGETVSFAPGLSGTITLGGSALNINNNITITGPGASTLSVSGNDTTEVFVIYGKTVQISNLTITHGYVMDGDGGAINNWGGNLTLDHVVVSNSQAQYTSSGGRGGGIFNYGSLTVTNSAISYNTASKLGGGIYGDYDTASLSLTNTTLDHNASYDSGGGLYIANPQGATATYTLDRVSVTDNNASGSGGGGIFLGASANISNSLIANNSTNGVSGAGGGIEIKEAGGSDSPVTILLTNVTVSGNTSIRQGGGMDVSLQNASDSVTLNNVTIANNHVNNSAGPSPIGGGGIYAAGIKPIDLENTILAGNTSAAPAVGPDCDGTLNSLDYNLIGNLASCTLNGTTSHTLIGNPMLDTLKDNGGPTLTMSLLVSSPAFDAGDDATCAATDQRGVARPIGAHCDIGAFEGDSIPPTVLSSVRASANPTNAASVNFTVTFSEPVTGVDLGDFALTTSGVSGATLSGFSGSNAVYTVTVSTGTGNGTIRLDIPVSATIADLSSNPLAGLPYTGGESYAIVKTAPLLISPANGAALHMNRPAFDWTDFVGSKGYQLQVSKVNTFSTTVLNVSIGATASTYTPTTNLFANTTLYWRVRSKVTSTTYTPWSAVWSFKTGNPPSTPSLVAPASGALVAGPSPLFDWGNSTLPAGTTFDHYQIQVATDSGFTTLVHDLNIAGITNSQDNTAVLTPATTYYWRVRAFNTAGDYSAWSTVRSVKIKYVMPTLLGPADLSAVGSLKPVFTWSAVTGAATYSIQISKSTAFGMGTISANVSLPTYTPGTSLVAKTKYYWRVRVNGAYGPSDWSLVFSFTTP